MKAKAAKTFRMQNIARRIGERRGKKEKACSSVTEACKFNSISF